MTKKWKLEPDTIPKATHGINLRSHLQSYQWDRIRRHCYKKAGYKCEICGGVGQTHPVECHEEWEWDFSGGYQVLKGVTALCPSCHEVKHIGLARVRGRFWDAMRHMASVNGKTVDDCKMRMSYLSRIAIAKSESITAVDMNIAEKLERDACNDFI